MRTSVLRLWRWISSLRFTVWVLGLLSIASAIGGIVPQAPTVPNAELLYRRYGQILYSIIKIFGFDDVFHSWWFVALLALFAIDLISCTTRRFIKTMHVIRSSIGAPDDLDFRQALTAGISESQRTLAEVHQAVIRAFRKKKLKVQKRGELIVGIRWRYGILGPDIAHIGIGIILIGTLCGIFKFQSRLSIRELQLGQVFQPCSAQVGHDCLNGIPFSIRVDDFGVDLHPGTITPKQYWTIVTVLENGEEVETCRIEVNRPFTYRGITFYQTSYGHDLNAAQITVLVVDWSKRENLGAFSLRLGDAFRLPNREDFVVFTRFFTTYAVKADGSPMNLDTPFPQNPAATLVVHEADKVYVATLFANALPYYSHPNSPYAFYLQGFHVPRYVMLTYSHDPGYPIVFGGFVLMTVGLFWSFYFRPRKAWVLIDLRGNKIFLFGDAKTRRLHKIWLEELVAAMEEEFEGGGHVNE